MKLLIVCAFSFVLGMISGAVIAFKSADDKEAMTEGENDRDKINRSM